MVTIGNYYIIIGYIVGLYWDNGKMETTIWNSLSRPWNMMRRFTPVLIDVILKDLRTSQFWRSHEPCMSL